MAEESHRPKVVVVAMATPCDVIEKALVSFLPRRHRQSAGAKGHRVRAIGDLKVANREREREREEKNDRADNGVVSVRPRVGNQRRDDERRPAY